MKDLTNKKFNMLTALYPLEERKHNCVVWHCKCECGNECDVASYSLTHDHTKSCGCLNNKRRAERFKKYNKEHRETLVGKIFNNNVLILEETEERLYSNLLYKCKCLNCGKEWYMPSHQIKKTKSCGCLNPTHFIDLTGQKFGMLTALEYFDNDNGNGTRWKCKCDCGNETIVRASSLKSGKTFSCGCLSRSKGEINIKKILEEKNILFEEQKHFASCVSPLSNRMLCFDFYLPSYKCLIEADGEQYYQPIKRFGGEEAFKKQKEKDAFKDQWCKENGMILIRIPYTHYQKIKLEDLLPETSKYINV